MQTDAIFDVLRLWANLANSLKLLKNISFKDIVAVHHSIAPPQKKNINVSKLCIHTVYPTLLPIKVCTVTRVCKNWESFRPIWGGGGQSKGFILRSFLYSRVHHGDHRKQCPVTFLTFVVFHFKISMGFFRSFIRFYMSEKMHLYFPRANLCFEN